MASNTGVWNSDYLVVAAFDFGTTFSGYAFSLRETPDKIQTNLAWNAGSEKLMSLKTPTCILLNPSKEFEAFGFQAENKYAQLADDEEHDGWLLFRKFKMILHNNSGLRRSTTVEDINGVSMPALTIFSMAIRYLKDHLLKTLDSQTLGLDESEIQYVVTVPAIWNDSAKQFMREAAIKAGLDSERVKLALEPEAASIWCQNVTTGLRDALSKAGNKYMVVDLGGGTADISVHEKCIDGSLKEIHRASGGPWGGNAVDQNYLRWLTKLFGQEAMDKFRNEEMADYFDLHREFETKKRNILPETDGLITFRVAASLREIHDNVGTAKLPQRLQDLGLSEKAKFQRDKLRIHSSEAKKWFEEPIGAIVKHMKSLLASKIMAGVDTILLVGGFGECHLVQEAIRKAFSNKRLVVPDEAGLAVLKGAVRFGCLPDVVKSRIMKYTYGIQTNIPFDEKKHPASRKKIMSGLPRLDGVFTKFVEVNSEVKVGSVIEKVFLPSHDDATGITIFASENANPFLVYDTGCREVGILDIVHPDGETKKDKEFNVSFQFGQTEILVNITILKSGRQFHTTVNCLE